ncbi:hypothetical protein COR50_00885 [Chitinophaga caeni]|uniref:Tetratricopeptide repeat protein n=2 Tax=Chitinophaga caeni TaxID=2029983 RepID=A0A291QPA4_9BACT|nr:hypothetical protein COR50_00885 [Chitinophaga caeni]
MGIIMNEQDFELIDQYLSGTMPSQEKEEFLERIAAEPELKAALEEWQAAQAELRQFLKPDENREQLQKHLAARRDLYFSHKKASIKTAKGYVISAFATAAVIAGLLFWSPWQKDITKEFPPTHMISATERGIESNNDLEAAENFYNDGQYAKAIPFLSNLLAKDPEDAFARYHRGVSFLENKQYETARADLLIIYNGESIFKYEGAFYIALSYLKQKDREKCKEWLAKIPENAGNYFKAQRLLKELK